MFDRLEDLVRRYQELMDELNAPEVVANQENFRRLMKEQNDLAPIVEAFQEYRSHQNNIQESLAMLEEERRRIKRAGKTGVSGKQRGTGAFRGTFKGAVAAEGPK